MGGLGLGTNKKIVWKEGEMVVGGMGEGKVRLPRHYTGQVDLSPVKPSQVKPS